MVSLKEITNHELLEQAAASAQRGGLAASEEHWALVQELHRRGGREAFETSASWCASADPLLRCLGADVLGQLGCYDSHPFSDESSPILESLLADSDRRVLQSALIALGHLRSGQLAAICALASHESAEVRHAVATCLGSRSEALARQTLIRLSADADKEVRNWATFGLGTLSNADSEGIRNALVARLSDSDYEVRGEAMRGLAARGDERAVPAILAELASDGTSVLAIEAAATLPREDFLPELERLLEANPESEELQLAVHACRDRDPAA